MSMFSRKLTSREKEVKFVGVHLPLPINSYATLYSLVQKRSKSAIICEVMEAWKEKESMRISIQDLINDLVESAMETYKGSKKSSLYKFIVEVKLELEKKGITDEIISKITKGIRDAANK